MSMAIGNTRARSVQVSGSTNDLLMQILLWLPVKSLMRFKLVSKHWKSLITSHYFSLLRYTSSNPVVGLICPGRKNTLFNYIPLNVTNSTQPPFTRLRFPGDNFSYWIHQSCNGLLLCCSSENLDWWLTRCRKRRCYVYNPNTKCFAKLPRPGVKNGVPRMVHGLNLAFDPSKSSVYKVVCVRSSEFGRETFQIEIYSSEYGVWRVSGEPFSTGTRFSYGVYWNGSIHWISPQPKELLYFNVDKEKLGKASLPARISGGASIERSVGYFGESRGHLHIVESLDERMALNVYEMKMDYSEWFVVYRVDVWTTTVAFPNVDELVKIICGGFIIYSLVRVDEGKGSFLFLRACGKVVRFNLDRNTFEEISDMGNGVAEYSIPCGFEHIESLAGV